MKLQVEEARNNEGKSYVFSFVEPAANLGDVDMFPWNSHDVTVQGEYWFDGNYLVVQGTIRTSGTYSCSRCLTQVSVQRDETLSESFGMEDDLPEDVWPYNGEYIDLTEAVRETLILSEPMRVLCRPNCKGLCPQCGADLNEGPCSCPTGSVDPRFAILGNLIDKTH